MFSEYHPENNDDDSDQKHKNGNPVYPVHVADPAIRWFVRVPFNEIKIFSYFS
jgi:hypothetical protein